MAIKDGDWELVDWDAATGRTVWQTFDASGNRVIRTDYPVGDVIEANTAMRNQTDSRRFGDWTRIGSVPLNIAFASGLIEAGAQQDQRFMSRWLNDSDNRAWRTHEGRV